MSSTTVLERGAAEEHERFRHDAVFYAGPADFVDRTASSSGTRFDRTSRSWSS
jgi:hypothetical protein